MCKKLSVLQCSLMVWQIFSVVHPGGGFPQGWKSSIPFDPSTDHIETDDLCLTSVCNQTASEVLKNMDKNVKPCDNFYRFACGNFLKTAIIPNDRVEIHPFLPIKNSIKNQLKAIIEQPSAIDEPKPFTLAKNFYKSCMNTDAIEEQGLIPILKLMSELGGWPVIMGDNWEQHRFSIKNATSQFFSFIIGIDSKSSTKKIIEVDQPALGIPQKYLLNGFRDPNVEIYYNYMVDIAVIFGADVDEVESEMMDVLELEIKIARICVPAGERRNMTLLYNPMTLATFTKLYPAIPLKYYTKIYFPPNIVIEDDELINVRVPQYFRKLNNLLSRISKKTMSNYVNWMIVRFYTSYLTKEVRERELQFQMEASGVIERSPRWDECISIVVRQFSRALSAMYVKTYFSEIAKKNAEEIVTDIRQQFDKFLEKINWMDDETKKNAQNKAKSMASFIAYSEELRDDSKIENYYKDLVIPNVSFLESIFVLRRFHGGLTYGKFREPFNKHDWENRASPMTVNAYYSPAGNYIEFPAGILQGAFFNSDRPKYMNYGAIGFVIGHEVTHGFDNIGNQYDKDGNVVDWWNSFTKDEFKKKTECIIQQYNNFTAKEVEQNLNGFNTLGENIADIGGIKGAYFAYLNWTKRNGQEPRLYGLEQYTPRQMFWISAANTWCSKTRPEAMRDKIINKVHSPAEFRIIGPLSNMPDFAKDFNCPANSLMGSKNRCSIW